MWKKKTIRVCTDARYYDYTDPLFVTSKAQKKYYTLYAKVSVHGLSLIPVYVHVYFVTLLLHERVEIQIVVNLRGKLIHLNFWERLDCEWWQNIYFPRYWRMLFDLIALWFFKWNVYELIRLLHLFILLWIWSWWWWQYLL